jgi:hypothetical protein
MSNGSRPKCLRCGAGPEWLQGKIPDELQASHSAGILPRITFEGHCYMLVSEHYAILNERQAEIDAAAKQLRPTDVTSDGSRRDVSDVRLELQRRTFASDRQGRDRKRLAHDKPPVCSQRLIRSRQRRKPGRV